MSVANTEVKQMQNMVSSDKKKKDYFTIWQAGLLILLTVVISTGVWYTVGKMFFWTGVDQKRMKQQLEYLTQQVQKDPKNLEYRVGLGYTYFLKGDNDKAIKELNQVLEMDKNYFDGHYNLGLVFSNEGRYDDALEQFQRCIELSPKDFKGYMQKGIVYRKLNMYEDALKILDKADTLMPGRADVIYEIGMVAEAKGDKKSAADIYKDALRYDPLFKDALDAIKRVQ